MAHSLTLYPLASYLLAPYSFAPYPLIPLLHYPSSPYPLSPYPLFLCPLPPYPFPFWPCLPSHFCPPPSPIAPRQVYKATLRESGATVAVKVQRPDIAASIGLDFLLIRGLCQLADTYVDSLTTSVSRGGRTVITRRGGNRS